MVPVVWEMLIDGHDREEIVAAVAARFEQDPAVIRRDVERFISDLEAKSLLVPVDRGVVRTYKLAS